MSDRAWTLLLMGEENGIVGGPGRTFEKHPAHYERVTVIERDPALARIRELEAACEKAEYELDWHSDELRKLEAEGRLFNKTFDAQQMIIEELRAENARLREAVDLVILKHRVRKERGTLVYFELPSEELKALVALLGGGDE